MTDTKQQFVVSDRVGERLDQWLAQKMKISRSQVRIAIKEGRILVNSVHVKPGYTVKHGDEVTFVCSQTPEIQIRPEAIPLDIVYEDEELAVINKPKNLVIYPATRNWSGTLVNALLHHFPELSRIGGKLRPGIVHRLDKDTSGLMVIAKNDQIHHYLAQQFKERKVTRAYLALVHGNLARDRGVIEAPIGRHPKERTRMTVIDGGRPAVTEFTIQRRCTQYTLVECRLQTGRTHQIRVHMAAIGHPVVGDKTYGAHQNNLGANSQALHAYLLAFKHPKHGLMEFKITSPELEKLIEKACKSA